MVHLATLIGRSSHVRIVPPERLLRLMIGRLLVEEYGASLNLAVAASFAGVRLAGFADALSRHRFASSIPVTGVRLKLCFYRCFANPLT